MPPSQKKLIKYHIFKNSGKTSFQLKAFFKAIALCHSVIVNHSSSKNSSVSYSSKSPDELALIKGARSCGVVLQNKESGTITLRHKLFENKNKQELPASSQGGMMSMMQQVVQKVQE